MAGVAQGRSAVAAVLLALLALLGAAAEQSFEEWAEHFGRAYASPAEAELRRAAFEAGAKRRAAASAPAGASWTTGPGPLADRTEDELRALKGLDRAAVHRSRALGVALAGGGKKPPRRNSKAPLPRAVDWRDAGVVTPVKNQMHCGSCWSFAAAETVESAWALATGELQELSEQHILDCTPNAIGCGGTGGCHGGTAELAFSSVQMRGGVASERAYPYRSSNGTDYQCRTDVEPVATVSGYVTLPTNLQTEDLMFHLATRGPLAISVDATGWHDYVSGVFDGCNRTNPTLDHAVQLVGYGTDDTLGDYWLVRNSWSTAWGEGGYIRIRRRMQDTCGWDLHPTEGSECKGGPPSVKVCGACGILFDVTAAIVLPQPRRGAARK